MLRTRIDLPAVGAADLVLAQAQAVAGPPPVELQLTGEAELERRLGSRMASEQESAGRRARLEPSIAATTTGRTRRRIRLEPSSRTKSPSGLGLVAFATSTAASKT